MTRIKTRIIFIDFTMRLLPPSLFFYHACLARLNREGKKVGIFPNFNHHHVYVYTAHTHIRGENFHAQFSLCTLMFLLLLFLFGVFLAAEIFPWTYISSAVYCGPLFRPKTTQISSSLTCLFCFLFADSANNPIRQLDILCWLTKITSSVVSPSIRV